MANAESKQQYEGAILQQLIKNSERLVVVENDVAAIKVKIDVVEKKVDVVKKKVDVVEKKVDAVEKKVDYIYSSLKWIIGLLGTILVAVLANLLSPPILSWLN